MRLLNLKLILLCCCPMASESSIWQKITEGASTGVFTLLGISVAAYLAYRFALKQKRLETFIGLEKIKFERKLSALESCWKLLVYTTDTENEKSILTWEQPKGKEKKYFLNTANAKEFITDLANFNYGTGLGIYLSKKIKEQLFEYRSILYGFLLRERENQNSSIEILNVEMALKMIHIHQNLIIDLKNETDVIDKTGMEKY